MTSSATETTDIQQAPARLPVVPALYQPFRGKPPRERGRLEIKDHIYDKITRRAVLAVPGVARSASSWKKVTGGGFPKIRVDIAGQRLRVAIDLAVGWPVDVAAVTSEVCRSVSAELSHITGHDVAGVDVHVAAIHRDAPELSVSRRVQ